MFALSSQPGPGYLLVILTGEMGAAEIASANSYLMEMARQIKVDVVLLDIMGAAMTVRPDEVAQLQAHLEAGTPHLRRLAIALKPEDDRGLLAALAEKLGVEFRQFGNLRDAEAWVASGGRPWAPSGLGPLR